MVLQDAYITTVEDYTPGQNLPFDFAQPAFWPGWQEASRRARLPLHIALTLLPESARLKTAYSFLYNERPSSQIAQLQRKLDMECCIFMTQVHDSRVQHLHAFLPQSSSNGGTPLKVVSIKYVSEVHTD